MKTSKLIGNAVKTLNQITCGASSRSERNLKQKKRKNNSIGSKSISGNFSSLISK